MGRSRGGCPNCKRRKRKCDETRPECRACQTRGVRCEGYNTMLKWNNGIASRGRFARAAVPDDDAAQRGPEPTPTTSSSSSCPPAMDDPQRARGSSSSASLGTRGLGSSPQSDTQGLQLSISTLTCSPAGDVTDLKQQLFQRCKSSRVAHELHSSLMLIDNGMNRLYTIDGWLKGHFLAMAERSQAFFYVGGAVQAYLEDGLSVSTMERVDNALQTFRSELESRHESFDASTVSAGLLVCSLCLFQTRPWTIYLHLMADLYHLETDMGSLFPTADFDIGIHHCVEVLSIMDLFPLVIGRMTPSIDIWRRLRKVQDGWQGGRIGGIEVVSGMPRAFLDILADMGDSEAQEMEARLWAWPGDIGLYPQCILWDCWRYTAVLHVRRIERTKKKTRPSAETIQPGVGAGETAAFPSREVVLCRLVASVYALHRVVTMPTNQHLVLHNGLIYPWVIGTLEVPLLATHPEWKQVFDDVRTLFQKHDSSRLIKCIGEIHDEAWEEGSDTFDVEEAARVRQVEIPVF
ncbi:hypothetical protein LX36DRAFT_577706 [Colletotrichum falcatum]|nr:hypothetical protein LX36DRAFT_577706 [Colletotrichum falcatum]